MRCVDSGVGRIKGIITIALIAGMIYVGGFKILPVWVHAYQLQDYLRDIVFEAMSGKRTTVETIRKNILDRAQELELPVKPDDVKVDLTMQKIVINLDYRVPVELGFYTLNLHFTPSAENRAL